MVFSYRAIETIQYNIKEPVATRRVGQAPRRKIREEIKNTQVFGVIFSFLFQMQNKQFKDAWELDYDPCLFLRDLTTHCFSHGVNYLNKANTNKRTIQKFRKQVD